MVEQSHVLVIPFAYKKVFDQEKQSEVIKSFKNYDADGNGTISAAEFANLIKDLGIECSAEEQKSALDAVDKNHDSVIDWMEFLEMFKTIHLAGSAEAAINKLQSGEYRGKDVHKLENTTGMGIRMYTIEERSTCARMVNKWCKDSELLQDRLPMDPDNEDLFTAMSDGMVLIHLLNYIEKDVIDMRSVNKMSNPNIYQVRENIELAMTGCKGIIKTTGINVNAFTEKNPFLLLAILVQCMRLLATNTINLNNCKELFKLKYEDEDMEDFLKLSPEALLIRWVNYHLKEAGQPIEPIKNLGKDIADSKAMTYVLNQLDKGKCSLAPLEEEDKTARACQMVKNSADMGVADVASGADIVKGNAKVNAIFVAEVFNTKHGLDLSEEEWAKIGMMDFNDEGSREEKAFRMWINSLDIEGVFVTNLYQEASDGNLLCKVIDRVQPGSVDWSTLEKNAGTNIYKQNHNAGIALVSAAKLTVLGKPAVKTQSVGAEDIRQGSKKNILALVWQIVRVHYMELLGSKSEKDIMNWITEKAKPDSPITKWKDSQFSDGKILIKLAEVIEPRNVNWDYFSEEDTDEAREMNAKYAISLARKLGAVIFLAWDDIPDLNPKMLLVFCASLYDIYMQVHGDDKAEEKKEE